MSEETKLGSLQFAYQYLTDRVRAEFELKMMQGDQESGPPNPPELPSLESVFEMSNTILDYIQSE